MYLYPTDIYYIVLVVPALIIAFVAQLYVKTTFEKYSKIISNNTAENVTRKILDSNDLSEVRIETVGGDLTDHYDPGKNVIRLSQSVYGRSSVAAVGVAAHETGHAIQKKRNYLPIQIRNFILPVAQLASYAAVPLAVMGMIFGNFLLDLGVILFSATVLFQIVTLPVEFDASKRAVRTLREEGFMDEEELKGVKKVLTAAALTYVAAVLVALMNLLRLVLIANKNRRD